MKQYTIEELTNPETYQNDIELAQFAREFAGSIQQIIRQEHGWREPAEVVFTGVYAERLHRAIEKRRAKLQMQNNQQARELADAQQALASLKPPANVTVSVSPDGRFIWVVIPRDGGIMTPKIKRLGGDWDMDNKRFWLPLTAAPSLSRILKNWETEFNKAAIEAASKKQADEERREREQREREAKWAAEREANQRKWAQEKREREAQAAHARANRKQVIVGQYQVGDNISWGDTTRKIESFGKSWTATEYKVPDKYWHGTLYQECAHRGCHNEPVELDTEMCERHHPESVQVTTEYCYAYLA